MGCVSEEVKMQKGVLILATSALILACGAAAASAQQGPMMQPQAQTQQQKQPERLPREAQAPRCGADDDLDDDSGITGWHGGPGWRRYRDWGREDTGFGMMGRGGMMGQGGMPPGRMMRMLFAMMDGDGDGTVSLEEFQAAHERIFRAMDANKDGKLTLEEIMAFMQGARAPAQRQ
jgi:hypothetical protein